MSRCAWIIEEENLLRSFAIICRWLALGVAASPRQRAFASRHAAAKARLESPGDGMDLENLGIVGNCQYSAIIANTGEVVWCCMPRFDSEPVFSTLLDSADGGKFTVSPAE